MNNVNVLIALGFPIFFVTFWCFTLWLLSRLSGWSKLAGAFHCPDKFTGQVFSFQSAKINWVNFNNGLKIGVSPQGLYLEPILIFRIFFPPFLIPWSEINSEPKKKFLVEYQQLTLASFPGQKIDLHQSTFEKITQTLAKQTQEGSARQE